MYAKHETNRQRFNKKKIIHQLFSSVGTAHIVATYALLISYSKRRFNQWIEEKWKDWFNLSLCMHARTKVKSIAGSSCAVQCNNLLHTTKNITLYQIQILYKLAFRLWSGLEWISNLCQRYYFWWLFSSSNGWKHRIICAHKIIKDILHMFLYVSFCWDGLYSDAK